MTQPGVKPSFYRIILSVSGCHAMAVRKVSPEAELQKRQNRRASIVEEIVDLVEREAVCVRGPWGGCTQMHQFHSWAMPD
jgi:hypothetical protein